MKKTTKLISILLVLAMLLSMAPISAFAADGDKASVTDKDGNAVGTYKTFADAVTAASASEGSTLTLLDDVTLTEEQYIKSGTFTLDLNGKTLLHKSIYFFEIQSDADIIIKDSGENGTIETKEDGFAAIYNYGILTVENGAFKGSFGISNIGTLNFKNG